MQILNFFFKGRIFNFQGRIFFLKFADLKRIQFLKNLRNFRIMFLLIFLREIADGAREIYIPTFFFFSSDSIKFTFVADHMPAFIQNRWMMFMIIKLYLAIAALSIYVFHLLKYWYFLNQFFYIMINFMINIPVIWITSNDWFLNF